LWKIDGISVCSCHIIRKNRIALTSSQGIPPGIFFDPEAEKKVNHE